MDIEKSQEPAPINISLARETALNAKGLVVLALFLIIVLGGGTAIGVMTLPGAWYADLVKPSFNPPNWVFGPVWTVLYIAIAVAGWRCWTRDPQGRGFKIWVVQLLANFAWSPLFFAAQRTDIAFGVILFMLIAIVAFIWVAWPRDRIAAALFVPYAAWVAFASVLNGAILFLNLPAAG